MQMGVKEERSNIIIKRWEVQGSSNNKGLLTEEKGWLWWDIFPCNRIYFHQCSVKLSRTFDMQLEQMDYKPTFLYGDLEEQIYII